MIFCLIFVTRCAQQVRPSGGPPDKTPPRIVNVIPENNSTLVPLDQRIEFEFSESMDRKSLGKAIFITPDPGEDVEFKWKKRKFRIEFSDSLKVNRTYVITLGTDLKDSHGNALTQSYTLAFSTGAEISDGKINGQVYAEQQPKGILIWAYILEGNHDPNPTDESADYVTQTGSLGKYELSHLSEGLYRIIAIQDNDGNRFFDDGTDGLGIASKDVLLTKDSLEVADVNFRISVRDTLGPALTSVSPLNNTQITMRFDEELMEESVTNLVNYTIRAEDKQSGDILGVRLAYLNYLDPQELVVLTEKQKPQVEYQIVVENIKDIFGNLIDLDFNKDEFRGSALPDTLKPEILKTVPEDSARAVFLDSQIEFYFNEPMAQISFENNFSLQDSSGRAVAGAFAWKNPAFVRFHPTNRLQSLTRYQISVNLDSVFDFAGNAIADSILRMNFTSINVDTLSSILGIVADPDSSGQGRIFLKVRQNKRDGQSYVIQLDEPGPYEFKNILPGTYLIEGFRDRDNNGEYSFGRAVPFQPSERFIVYPDSVKVRARWPNEGNDIVFK